MLMPTRQRVARSCLPKAGSFDSLIPYIRKGKTPWQLRFMLGESLMGRSWDEPFTLYGLLAESVETDEDRTWVEFTFCAKRPNSLMDHPSRSKM